MRVELKTTEGEEVSEESWEYREEEWMGKNDVKERARRNRSDAYAYLDGLT